MRLKNRLPFLLVSCFALISLAPLGTSGQADHVQPRIAQAVNESQLTVLRGNTHPLARAEFDRGPAPANLPMRHMLLVLRRSPQQEAALDALLARQQDRSSPDYHHWLTPGEFGRQFGPADQDIQTVTSWLGSHGFQVNKTAKSRTVIDFSGTAGQVQGAFHTVVHSYAINADATQHWANASDPMIPTALLPVIAGVTSLNNFPKKPMSRTAGIVRRSKVAGKGASLKPQFTYTDQQGNQSFALGPYDFAKIYNMQPLWTGTPKIDGTGVTIAVIGASDINLQDVANFKSSFGLPANPPVVILPPGETDPGIQPNGGEGEADLDVEWAGAVATGATIDLVISTNIDNAALYVVNSNPPPPILSESFGLCESQLGASGNAFYNSMWQQAASEGITVLIASGDSGSAGCDDSGASAPAPAQFGLAVNGLASTPYNIALGGTDFDDFNVQTQYWGLVNDPTTQASVLKYVPEIAYNDSCANPAFGATAEADCNDSQFSRFVQTVGGGGGPSNCTSGAGNTNVCSGGGYAKPVWQTGPGVPNDGKRDIPDVSLFAGDGLAGSFYVVCEQDRTGNVPCNVNAPYSDFLAFGGTSVSTQTFAGIMALVDQKAGSAQGNANPVLYALAAEQNAANCDSTGAAAPAASCIFNDVTAGSIAQPCQRGSTNCTTGVSSDLYGVLEANSVPAYGAGVGYDLATGLGSVNVANLVNGWGPNFFLSSSNSVITITGAAGSGTMALTATAVNGFSGQINFSCLGLPAGRSCSFNPTSVTLSSTTTSGTTTVNVSPATSGMLVFDQPSRFGRGIPAGVIAISGFLGIGMALFGFGGRNRRWGIVVAPVAFALLLMAACSSKTPTIPGGGGGSSSSATVTGTSTGGNATVTYPLSFTVTVQ